MRDKLSISGYYTTIAFIVYTYKAPGIANTCEKSDKSAMKYFDSSHVYRQF